MTASGQRGGKRPSARGGARSKWHVPLGTCAQRIRATAEQASGTHRRPLTAPWIPPQPAQQRTCQSHSHVRPTVPDTLHGPRTSVGCWWASGGTRERSLDTVSPGPSTTRARPLRPSLTTTRRREAFFFAAIVLSFCRQRRRQGEAEISTRFWLADEPHYVEGDTEQVDPE